MTCKCLFLQALTYFIELTLQTEAQEQIRKLEDQLRQTQAAKDELENGQKELQAMMKQLEESKNMEHQERERLEDEIRAKQNEVHSIYEQVGKVLPLGVIYVNPLSLFIQLFFRLRN